MSFSEINPKTKSKIKGLILEYKNIPQPGLLIPIPNPQLDVDYKITISSSEFTSLCPLATSQPDYATITIEYYPENLIVELKSLKFYLVSYRTVEIFHEAVVGQILKDLAKACNPRKMKVIGDFTIRGGVHTIIEASLSIRKVASSAPAAAIPSAKL